MLKDPVQITLPTSTLAKPRNHAKTEGAEVLALEVTPILPKTPYDKVLCLNTQHDLHLPQTSLLTLERTRVLFLQMFLQLVFTLKQNHLLRPFQNEGELSLELQLIPSTPLFQPSMDHQLQNLLISSTLPKLDYHIITSLSLLPLPRKI